MAFLAHYDTKTGWKQTIKEHLNAVADLIMSRIPPNVSFGSIENDLVRKIGFWLGNGHDLGKYTCYFQDYILNGQKSELKNHALVSGCFIYLLLNSRLNILNEKMVKEFAGFLAYISVRCHHGYIKLQPIGAIGSEADEWKKLYKQQEDLFAKKSIIADELKLLAEVNPVDLEKVFKIDELQNNREFVKLTMERIKRSNDERWYFYLLYLFSLIVDADKLDSARITAKNLKKAHPTFVTDYITEKHGSKQSQLIGQREKARNTMLNVVEAMTDAEIMKTRFFTLTAPTGIGKTLSSLQSVLRLQERIASVEGYIPRIITAIPFINIIEQTKIEYENVFKNRIELVVHHGMSDFLSRTKDADETQPLDKLLMEVEAWEGDVILTTFVQLFQSIFTNENRLLKKFNKLAGSIVVLDEAQAIPEKYLPLIGAVLIKLGEYCGTRFVLMTATQPKLLELGKKLLNQATDCGIIQLLPDYKEYFQGLKRTKFVSILNNKINTEQFLEVFQAKWNKKASVLIVVNTIKRSIDLFNRIAKLYQENLNISVFYLSTNIIPVQRRAVIRRVKNKLDNNETVILISTQTIEAGVDLDFDMAFRDFTLVDSFIQTAGRVNREGKKGDYLPIYLMELENDSQYVYELINRKSTKELIKQMFNEKGELLECDYGAFAERYYTKALATLPEESKVIWNEGILKLDFEVINQFMMIDKISEVYDVFVEDNERYNGLPGKLADIYEKLMTGGDLEQKDYLFLNIETETEIDIFKRKALLKMVIAKMNDFKIQVRVNRAKNNRPIEFAARNGVESSFYWIPPGQIKQYYDENTGFIEEAAFVF